MMTRRPHRGTELRRLWGRPRRHTSTPRPAPALAHSRERKRRRRPDDGAGGASPFVAPCVVGRTAAFFARPPDRRRERCCCNRPEAAARRRQCDAAADGTFAFAQIQACGSGSARVLSFSGPFGPGYRNGDDPALRRRRRQLELCHARSRLPIHGGLPHRPGYAVVPQLEPGAVRRAIALRGKESRDAGERHDRFA